MPVGDALIAELDAYFGPHRSIVSVRAAPNGHYFARLVCGHEVRTLHTSDADVRWLRMKSGVQPGERCYHCKRAGQGVSE